MDWLRITEDGEVEVTSDEVKLTPEYQTCNSLAYNKSKGDADGRKKYRFKDELKYMCLAYSQKSPYKDYNEKERIEEARLDCKLKPDWVESPELKKLIEKYVNNSPNKVQRLLRTTERFIDKFEIHLNSIDLNEKNSAGSLIHKPTDIMATLERLPRLAETLFELESQARMGAITKHSSRGDHELGWMNKSNNKPQKQRGQDGESNTGYSEESEGEVQ